MSRGSVGALAVGLALAWFGLVGACDVSVTTEGPSGPGWGPGANVGGTGGSGEEPGGSDAYPAWCAECHGTEDDPAPPPDRNGESDTTIPGVGAHQTHFHNSAWHLRVGCNQCHAVPVIASWDPNVPTHLNDENDMTWGAIAGDASYDAETHVCTNVYCHGATLPPDDPELGVTTVREPVWNQVDGTQAVCGAACHTNPPIDANHAAADTDCERSGCHSAEIGVYDVERPADSLWLLPDLHVDGKVDSD